MRTAVLTTGIAASVMLAVAACTDTGDNTVCSVRVVSRGMTIGADTVVASGDVNCYSTVYLDSAGSDTTPSGSSYTVYRYDSAGSDTTPGG